MEWVDLEATCPSGLVVMCCSCAHKLKSQIWSSPLCSPSTKEIPQDVTLSHQYIITYRGDASASLIASPMPRPW